MDLVVKLTSELHVRTAFSDGWRFVVSCWSICLVGMRRTICCNFLCTTSGLAMNMDVLVNDESILLRMHVHIESTEMTLIYDETP